MSEIIVTGGDGDGGDLGAEAERDAFVAAGAASAHEENAEHHAAVASEAASTAAALTSEVMSTAEEASVTAEAAIGAADSVASLIAAHTQAMQEQTAAIGAFVAQLQQTQSAPPPAPEKPATQKPDREPKGGRKKFRDAYFGNGR